MFCAEETGRIPGRNNRNRIYQSASGPKSKIKTAFSTKKGGNLSALSHTKFMNK
jgi:hypothetical protein